jgi:hypothetical protein
MESIPAWFAVIVGGLGTAAGYGFSFLSGREAPGGPAAAEDRADRRRAATALIIALVIAAVLFGVSWIKRPVIAELNKGACSLLFGVLAAAAMAAMYVGAAQRWRREAAKAGTRGVLMGGAGVWLLSAAVFIVGLTNVIFRRDTVIDLVGCALGVTYVAGVVALVTTMGADRGRGWIGYWAMTLTVILLAFASVLARLHFPGEESAGWWGVPLGLAAAAIVGATIAVRLCTIGPIGESEAVSFWVTALVTFIVAVGAAALVALRIALEWKFLWLFLGSGGVFLLISYAVRRPAGDGRGREGAAAAAVLLLFLIVVSFRILGAFGTSVAALGGLCFAVLPMGTLALVSDDSAIRRASGAILAALAMAIGFLAFRTFMEQSAAAIRRIDLDTHYTFIGLLLGALLPLILGDVAGRTPDLFTRGPWRAARRALFIWLIVAAITIGVPAIWGLKALMGLVAGVAMMLAVGFVLAASRRDEEPAAAGSPFTMGIFLLAVQFGGLAARFQTIPRAEKVWIVVVVAAVAGLWLIVSSIGRRRPAG